MDRFDARVLLLATCQWVTRLAASSLCAYWIILRGGIVLGLFPALSALLAQSRRWLSGKVDPRSWAELSSLARRDFACANQAGYAATGPVLAGSGMVALFGGTLVQVLTTLALGLLLVLPVALVLSAWVRLPARTLALGPWLLLTWAPLRAALAALSVTAAAALGLIHPLLALYFAPALGALMVAAALMPLLSSPLLSIDRPAAASPIQRIVP